MFTFLGILGAFAFIAADIPYIRDTLRGETKPHRVSWFLFFVLNAINVANQAASGATNSLWVVIAATFITFVVFILSLKKGVGGFEKLDIVCLVGGLAGLVLWAILRTPVASLACNLIVVTIALAPTLKKAYLQPGSETKISWIIAALSDLAAAVSVGSLNYRLLLLPIHGFIIQLCVYIVLVTRDKQRPKLSD